MSTTKSPGILRRRNFEGFRCSGRPLQIRVASNSEFVRCSAPYSSRHSRGRSHSDDFLIWVPYSLLSRQRLAENSSRPVFHRKSMVTSSLSRTFQLVHNSSHKRRSLRGTLSVDTIHRERHLPRHTVNHQPVALISFVGRILFFRQSSHAFLICTRNYCTGQGAVIQRPSIMGE